MNIYILHFAEINLEGILSIDCKQFSKLEDAQKEQKIKAFRCKNERLEFNVKLHAGCIRIHRYSHHRCTFSRIWERVYGMNVTESFCLQMFFLRMFCQSCYLFCLHMREQAFWESLTL